MRAVILISFAAISFAGLENGLANAGKPAHVRLHSGQAIKLHVGQVADLELPSGHPYSVDLAGDAVVPMESRDPKAKIRSYRAARPGNATLLIAPADREPGQCVDCVTRHCFLTVVP